MPWTRLDDQYFFHPKIIKAGKDARDLDIAAITYSNGQLTDGFIPKEALALIAAMAIVEDVTTCVDKLVEQTRWERVDGGYLIHDFLDYNPSKEEVLATRAARAEAGRKGGLQAAASKAQAKAKANAQAGAIANAQANEKQNSTPSPSPSPSPISEPIPKEEIGADAPPVPELEYEPCDQDGEPLSEKPKRKYKPSLARANRLALGIHFSELTKIPLPESPGDNKRQYREQSVTWWGPLKQILALKKGDMDVAKSLIADAVREQSGSKYNISSPKSILKTAIGIHSRNARASPEGWTSQLTGETVNHG